MKKYLCLLFFIVAINGFTNAQWSAGFLPAGRVGNAVHIIDAQNAVVAGGNEFNDKIQGIFITNNQASSWILNRDIPDKPWLKSLHFFNVSTGIAVGYEGAIIRTTNGGSTWDSIAAPGNALTRNFNAIFFTDNNTGFIAGGNRSNDSIQTILKTTDGGITWSVLRDVPGYWLTSIWFTDNANGIAVGDRGTILKTTDGGNNWSVITVAGNAGTRHYNCVNFINNTTGIIVGGNPSNDSIQTILKTTDGGNTWNVVKDNIGPMLNGVDFATGTKAYAVGNNGVLFSTDDTGDTWAPVLLADTINDTIRHLNAINFLNSDFGIAVGRTGKVLKYINGTPQAPAATTLPATNVTSNSALINGSVNARGALTTVTFEYGTTTALGNTINGVPATTQGNSAGAVSVQLNGLNTSTFYYYRVKAVSTNGIAYGDIKQFYTTNCEVPNCDFEIWDTLEVDKPVLWGIIGSCKKVTSHNGSFAAEITGNPFSDDIGAIVLGDVRNDQIKGGLYCPVRPDSIAMHAKYDIAAGDTGYLVAFFLKANNVIYQCINPITGSSGGNWAELKYPVTFPTADVPDTVVIGVLSSNGFGGKGNPNSKITVDDIRLAGTNAPAVTNGNLQLWETAVTDNLRYWDGDKENGIPPVPDPNSIEFIQKSSDAVTGNYSMRMRNDAQQPTRSISMSVESPDYGPHFAIAGKHNTLNMYIKFLPQNNDSLEIQLGVFMGDSVVGYAGGVIDTAVPNFTPFAFDIIYNNTGQGVMPDSANLNINLGNFVSKGNSIAYIDNISFDGFRGFDTTSIDTNHVSVVDAFRNMYCNIFPNPAKNTLHVQYFVTQPGIQQLQVFDLTGKKMLETSETSETQGLVTRQFNVAALPAGYYLLSISSNTGTRTFRFAVH